MISRPYWIMMYEQFSSRSPTSGENMRVPWSVSRYRGGGLTSSTINSPYVTTTESPDIGGSFPPHVVVDDHRFM